MKAMRDCMDMKPEPLLVSCVISYISVELVYIFYLEKSSRASHDTRVSHDTSVSHDARLSHDGDKESGDHEVKKKKKKKRKEKVC